MPKTDIGKYGVQFATKYSNEETKEVEAIYNTIATFPIEVQEDLYLGLSHILNKYGFSYNELMDKTKVQVGEMIMTKKSQ